MEEDVVSFILLSFVVHSKLEGSFLDDDVLQRDLTYIFSLKLHKDVNGVVETCLESWMCYCFLCLLWYLMFFFPKYFTNNIMVFSSFIYIVCLFKILQGYSSCLMTLKWGFVEVLWSFIDEFRIKLACRFLELTAILELGKPLEHPNKKKRFKHRNV